MPVKIVNATIGEGDHWTLPTAPVGLFPDEGETVGSKLMGRSGGVDLAGEVSRRGREGRGGAGRGSWSHGTNRAGGGAYCCLELLRELNNGWGKAGEKTTVTF